ncbi:MAG: CpaD family pilus assembly protein [Alphaproteobacteria bacterium]|nr:CpaD family pilus assembly protein [Alphaproteobacteria bacterium]
MTKRSPLTAPVRSLAVLGLGAALLTGCAEPKPEGYDYRETHPIQVARERVTLSIELPDEGTRLNTTDAGRFRAFLRDFAGRGQGQVTVEAQDLEAAYAVLTQNGFRESELTMIGETTVATPIVVLSFTAAKAVAPECGDWSGNATFTPGNKPHGNYGCATQRNKALMAADPDDFLRAKPMSGGGAASSDAAIGKYSAGGASTTTTGK